ncbi:hypothetical protein [Parvicella tangerina]|uniref:Lipocalin-like domain-containing protein n=1 Tax=Parvicella tangerina TaxID=2829795 RepID=A0A916NCD6_9FLAO|nr:hypothetical protein [Parvicella tangerina]CAG5082851.1 hypothetical protein CRYO30217_02026 [Parvicella tangerina]
MVINFKHITVLIAAISLFSCASSNKNSDKEQVLTTEDVQGHWRLVRIDTIIEKQSLSQNENYNNYAVEYQRPDIQPVDGVLKCTNCLGDWTKTRTIDFSNDTVYDYVLPNRRRAFYVYTISGDTLKSTHGFPNRIWIESVGDVFIRMNVFSDTLQISYLEETGFYLTEVYARDSFDETIVNLIKNYGVNLPNAAGKYSLVHYDFQTVDYDSPFEHYHSFPHDVPETLNLSETDLLEVLKNESIMEILTDGELKPYILSWSGGERLWIHPDFEWYDGPDTSSFILYDKIQE